jgi:hypothetical protein
MEARRAALSQSLDNDEAEQNGFPAPSINHGGQL